MGAVLHQAHFRPVALQETYLLNGKLFSGEGTVLRELGTGRADSDDVVFLTRETCFAGDQVGSLPFTPVSGEATT